MFIKAKTERKVDRSFDELNGQHGKTYRNPVTDGPFVWGIDPIEPQKEIARRALRARERFAADAPPDAPPLPVSGEDVEAYRNARGLKGVIGFYARSLAIRGYDTNQHPSFDDFARGLMASDTGLWGIEKDNRLRRRFPPKPLKDMTPGLYWAPPKEYEEIMASYHRAA